MAKSNDLNVEAPTFNIVVITILRWDYATVVLYVKTVGVGVDIVMPKNILLQQMEGMPYDLVYVLDVVSGSISLT